MPRAILVILDGLRRDLVTPETTPRLAAFAARSEQFAAHRTVFPSCTRVVSASLATGCHPVRHGLQGNTMALMENGRLVRHDAGQPDFLQHKRRVTGRSLAVPTLAERLTGSGGAIIFSNVSPGAAYAHDPDGFGRVYHRAGSFGRDRVPLPEDEQLRITKDVEGDRAMTERFIREAVLPNPIRPRSRCCGWASRTPRSTLCRWDRRVIWRCWRRRTAMPDASWTPSPRSPTGTMFSC